MKETGMTQSQLSMVTGVSQGRISSYVNDRVGMTDEMLSYLGKPLGMKFKHTWDPVPIKHNRDERRSWMFHLRLSELLDDNLLNWLPTMESNLRTLRTTNRGEPHFGNVERWRRLVESRSVRDLRSVMVDPDRDGIEMREVSPFNGCLTERDRVEILRELRR